MNHGREEIFIESVDIDKNLILIVEVGKYEVEIPHNEIYAVVHI